ncbi:hypothetical protein VTK56DRAFT_8467 [Thermocarpiscus australiensis]
MEHRAQRGSRTVQSDGQEWLAQFCCLIAASLEETATSPLFSIMPRHPACDKGAVRLSFFRLRHHELPYLASAVIQARTPPAGHKRQPSGRSDWIAFMLPFSHLPHPHTLTLHPSHSYRLFWAANKIFLSYTVPTFVECPLAATARGKRGLASPPFHRA